MYWSITMVTMEQAMLGIGTIIFIIIIIRLFITKERHKETIEKLDELRAAIARLEQIQQERIDTEVRFEEVPHEQKETEARFEEVQQEHKEIENVSRSREIDDEPENSMAQPRQAQGEQSDLKVAVRPRKLDEKPGYSARRRGGDGRLGRTGRG